MSRAHNRVLVPFTLSPGRGLLSMAGLLLLLGAGCADEADPACADCPPEETGPTDGTEPGPSEPTSPVDEPTAPAVNPFLGSFDCVQTSETFAGSQSSGETTVNLLLEVTAVTDSRVRLLSPGTRQNLFQGCATLLDTDGFTATHAGGDGCDNGFLAGSAAADPGGKFTADFDGNFAGYRVDVSLECEPRAAPPGDADASAFLGDWRCGGTQEGMMGTTDVDFELRLAATTGSGLEVTPLSGGDTPFAFCPAVFVLTGPARASLDPARSRCQLPTDGAPSSGGLRIEAGRLSGDYGVTDGVAGFVTFTCSRG